MQCTALVPEMCTCKPGYGHKSSEFIGIIRPQEAPLSGHPRFYEILTELRDLHDRKNHDYAAGGKPTGNFDRRAALFRLYPGLTLDQPYKVAAWDILKQLDAALWLLSQGHESQTGEGVAQRLRDVACYAILAELMYEARYVVGSPKSTS